MKTFHFPPSRQVIKSIIFIFDHVLSHFSFAAPLVVCVIVIRRSNKNLVCSIHGLKISFEALT